MVYLRANRARYLIATGVGTVLFLAVLAPFVPIAAILLAGLAFGAFADFPIWPALRGPGDRLDIFIDATSICGPVKGSPFTIAQSEAVPFSAIDIPRSRENHLIGSYFALKDGRKLVVSRLAHPAGNVRRVFDEIRKHVQE